MEDLIEVAAEEYQQLRQKFIGFDLELTMNLFDVGGAEYATLGALVYRQVFAACKMVWNTEKNTSWYFMKEISSDGDISTVDVVFPASPFLLYHNYKLLKLLLFPLLAYANNETSNLYPYPFSPHHLGFWPVANIQYDQQVGLFFSSLSS
jgi:hypothetical protein